MAHMHALKSLAAALAASGALAAFAADESTAKALMDKSECWQCHTIEKAKAGPAYREVAKKYRGQADAVDKLYKHATTRPMVKVDGNMEEHATLKSKNPAEIRNAIQWILSF